MHNELEHCKQMFCEDLKYKYLQKHFDRRKEQAHFYKEELKELRKRSEEEKEQLIVLKEMEVDCDCW